MREVSVPALYECPDEANAADIVFEQARTRPNAIAFSRREGEGRWSDVSYADFAADVVRLARGLIGAGIEPGDRIALMSHTRYEWGVIDFAVQTVQAIVVPVYESSSPSQIAWIASDCAARMIIVEDAGMAKRVAEARDEMPALEQVWVIEDGALDAIGQRGDGVTEDAVHERRTGTRADDDATIVYTSGSTGQPKGCRLTHRNLISNSRNAVQYAGDFIKAGASTLLFLPLAHVFARLIQLGSLTAGARIGHQPDISQLLPALAEFRPTFVLAVPRVFEKVYNSAEQKAHNDGKGKIFDLAARTSIAWSRARDAGRVPVHLALMHAVLDKLVGSRIRQALGGRCTVCVSGGAPLGERLGHFFRGVGIVVLEGYGMTETSPVSAVNTEHDNRVGTVGRPIAGCTIRVADDGELLVKGAHVFKGYWNNDEQTAESLRDGWLHTGDLGSIDDEGFVRITGRKKEILVTAGGKNVAPAVLEDRLRAHALVSQCIVVGDRRPFIGALVTLDREMLPGWLKEHGLDPDLEVERAIEEQTVRDGVQRAVDYANRAVSKAESIRKFSLLPGDFTEEGGHLTPSLKLKRQVVLDEFAAEVDGLYGGPLD